MKPPRILSIAGSDNSGGAGIQADIKTITMLRGHAMTAITAVTVQTSQAVLAVHPVPLDIIVAQIETCLADTGVDAIKIGMLGSAETAAAIGAVLARHPAIPVVLDPVMVASNGDRLADAATIASMRALAAQAAVITPNLPELAILADLPGDASEDALLAAAKALAADWGVFVVMKGGHGGDAMLTDRLIAPDGSVQTWADPRIDTSHSHGTGCTLSAALATGLGRGEAMADALSVARRFVRAALKAAPGYVARNGTMGHGQVRLED